MRILLDRSAARAGRALVCASLVGGAAIVLAHCGSATSDSGSFPAFDGGYLDDGSSGFDASLSSDASGSAATVLLLHASPDLPDFRVCLAIADSLGATPIQPSSPPFPDDQVGPMPESSYPGVPVGGGVALRTNDPPLHAHVVPYLISAQALIPGNLSATPCKALICGDPTCLVESAYTRLDPIDVSPLQEGGRFLLAITGCATPGTAACANAGPLTAKLFSLGPGDSSELDKSAQAVQLSPSLGPTTLKLGGTAVRFTLPAFGQPDPHNRQPIFLPDAGDLAAYATRTVTLEYGDASADFSLALVARLSNPNVIPSTYFERDRDFVFAVMGDPSAAPPLVDGGLNPSFNGRGLHVIALPWRASDPRDAGP